MGQISFRARLGAPELAEAPPELKAKWRDNLIASSGKALRTIKKSIRTRKDFDQKIGQPILDTQQSFINPAFISRKGRDKKAIIYKTKNSLKKAPRQYKKALKRVHETKEFEEKVDEGVRWFVKDYLTYTVPLLGCKTARIKGLAPLAAMTLAGDKDLKNFLTDRDKIIKGQPICIVLPSQKGKFKNALRNQIIRSGRAIIKSGYDPEKIQKENAVINRLAEKYRLPEFARFTPGGPSHIDFVLIYNRLYLDIQVASRME